MSADVNLDLDSPICRVELEFRRRLLPFINRDEICEKLTADTVQELKRNGINVENGFRISQMGGGGFDLWEQLRMLYEHRKLFGILILLVKLPRHLISNYFQYRHCAEKPLVTLCLDIRSEKNIDTTNFFDDLASRASVLCHALRAASMAISKEYPMYRFGFAVRIELFKNDYLAQIVCEDSANDLMSKRLCSVVSGIKFSDGLYLTVSPAKLGLICYKTQRLALRHDLKGDRKEFSAERKYYMYFSNNILSDFYGSRPKKRLSLKRILKNINFT